jgi:ribosomal protein S18 acetylase RimI-like enzyme
MPDSTYRMERLELPRDRETLLKFHDLYDKEYKFARKKEERDNFLKYLKEHDDIYHCLVLWHGDEPVGYLRGYDRLSTSSCDIVFMLDIVYVSPDHRGKGIGKKMIVHLIEYAREYGAARIDLLADTTNQVAQNLYKGFGFMGRTRYQMHRFIKKHEELTRYFDEKVAEEAALDTVIRRDPPPARDPEIPAEPQEDKALGDTGEWEDEEETPPQE